MLTEISQQDMSKWSGFLLNVQAKFAKVIKAQNMDIVTWMENKLQLHSQQTHYCGTGKRVCKRSDPNDWIRWCMKNYGTSTKQITGRPFTQRGSRNR
jgi:hypothetical protein